MKVYIKRGCLTCKRILDYLDKKKVDYQAIDFFKQPLSKDEIRILLKEARSTPRDAIRRKDRTFKELRLEAAKLSDEELISLMEKHPGLILRPIVQSKGHAVIATKPQRVDELLS